MESPQGTDPTLEYEMLETSDRPEVQDLKALRDMVSELDGNIWQTEKIQAIMQTFKNSLTTNAIYNDIVDIPSRIDDNPIINFAPAIILRKRNRRDFINFYDEIIKQINEDSTIPDGIHRIVDIVENNSDNNGHKGEVHIDNDNELTIKPFEEYIDDDGFVRYRKPE